MTNRLFYICVLVFLPISILTNCKSEPKRISEAEGYQAINDLIFQDTLIDKEICGRFAEIVFTEEMKKSFSGDELDFFDSQKRNLKTKNIKPNRIVYFHKGYKKGDFAELKQNCNEGQQYSFPLFTPDRKKMLIHMEYQMNGYHSSSDNLYEKEGENWILVTASDAFKRIP